MGVKKGFYKLFSRAIHTQHANTKAEFSVQVVDMISAFRNRGHFAALLDPLGPQRLSPRGDESPDIVQLLKNYPYPLDLTPFGLHLFEKEKALAERLDLGGRYSAFDGLSLRELISTLVDAYCGSVGIEYNHLENS